MLSLKLCIIVPLIFVLTVNGIEAHAPIGEDCPQQCGYNYDPVCGQSNNGRLVTFPSECEYKKLSCRQLYAGWSIKRVGECESADVTNDNYFFAKSNFDTTTEDDDTIAIPY